MHETKYRQKAMDEVVDGVQARKILFAMLFGNQDDENGLFRNTRAYGHESHMRTRSEVLPVSQAWATTNWPCKQP